MSNSQKDIDMSTSTLERPSSEAVKPEAEVEVKVKSKALAEDATIAKRLAKKTKKAWKKVKGWFRKAMRWMKDRAKRAWKWFTGKIKLGAKWLKKMAKKSRIKAKAAAKWTVAHARSVGRWALEWMTPVVAWVSMPVRVGLGTVFGVAFMSTFGGTILTAVVVGYLAYVLMTGRFSLLAKDKKSKSKKGKKGRSSKRASKKVVQEMFEGDNLGLNQAQLEALLAYVTELELERERQLEKGTTVVANSNLTGQLQMARKRLEGSTESRKEIFEEYKRLQRDSWENFDGLAISTGMRTADARCNQILAEHQVTAEPALV